MPKTSFCVYFLFLFSSLAFNLSGQAVLEFANVDLEWNRAGDKSDYYYNEISKNFLNRLGPYQVNLIGGYYAKEWRVQGRLLWERNLGRKFNVLKVPLLNIQWAPTDKDFQLTAGRFINPFGSFNPRQLPKQRNFIGRPLAYDYYVNISDKIGYLENMGDLAKVPVDGSVQWGSTLLYYGGYSTGFLFHWAVDPVKVNWDVALVNNASLGRVGFTDPIHLGLISRLSVKPVNFWNQGFSLSHGSFLRDSEFGNSIDNFRQYRQTLVGTDYKVGLRDFEFLGEIIWMLYHTPAFDADASGFRTNGEAVNLSGLSAYLDVKYILPFLARSYIAYRIDTIQFGKLDDGAYQNDQWDKAVFRHALAFGYELPAIGELPVRLLLRAYASAQRVEDKKAWEGKQNVFRLMLTIYWKE